MERPKQLIQPFQEALDEYKASYMAARNLAARSRKEYSTDIAQFLGFLESLGVRDLKAVGPGHVESFLAKMDQQGLAGVSRRRKLTVVRIFLGWLKSRNQIAGNPAKKVRPPRAEGKEPRVLTKEEYERLLAGVQKPRDRAIVQLLLQTGIRLAEIYRLTLSDLSLPKRVTKDTLGTLRILGKGRKTRTVLLNFKACEAVAAWLDVRPGIGFDALFLSSRQRRLSPRQFQYLVGKYLTKASIKGASVHTLRHTFATHHIEMGTDLVTVQEFLGHKSLDTTKLYIGLAKKRQAQHIQDHAL